MRVLTRTIGVAALLLTPAFSALAQEPPPAVPAPAEPPASAPPPVTSAPAIASTGAFGSLGQFALSANLPFLAETPQLALYHRSTTMNGGSSTNISVQPALDYFVAPNVSVGGVLGIMHGDGSALGMMLPGGATVTSFTVEARGGYNFAINDMFSVWPTLGLEYMHASISDNGISASGYGLTLILNVPVLWHPASHFFVGLGPMLRTDLIAKAEGNDVGKTTDVGLSGLIGGYF